jgi:hypothetical protein
MTKVKRHNPNEKYDYKVDRPVSSERSADCGQITGCYSLEDNILL